ncbi:MAG: protein-disulfide reductase DsbD N-terminal domain-containing protein [Acidobacteriia bacterium]|nr:protein-disulfide reductase DsbD N-terminal domain-containing protein [Terriglobia bacterium]
MLDRGLGSTAVLALVLICVLLIPGAATEGSGQIPREPVKWSIKATLPDKPLKPGDKLTLQLTAKIEEGWHLYATDQAEGGPTPTRIVVPSDQSFEQAGTIESSEPKSAMDPNFNLMTEYYEGQAAFTIPVKVAATATAGKSEVRVNVSFQTCNEELCLPPKTVKLALEVNLTR